MFPFTDRARNFGVTLLLTHRHIPLSLAWLAFSSQWMHETPCWGNVFPVSPRTDRSVSQAQAVALAWLIFTRSAASEARAGVQRVECSPIPA